jgi:hypothetical protein
MLYVDKKTGDRDIDIDSKKKRKEKKGGFIFIH